MMLYMPTIVYSERDCVRNHSKDLAIIGKKAMIITGKHSSRANGSLDDVINVLKAENIVLVDILDAEDERIKNDLYSELPGSPADGTQHFHCRA